MPCKYTYMYLLDASVPSSDGIRERVLSIGHLNKRKFLLLFDQALKKSAQVELQSLKEPNGEDIKRNK